MKIVTVLLSVVVLYAVVMGVQALSGTLLNAQPMYMLQDPPVDPTSAEITVTGKWSYNGKITMRIYNPNTTCVIYQGQEYCGNRATDFTVVVKAVHLSGPSSVIQLESVVDNIGPQNTGVTSDFVVGGYWDKQGNIAVHINYQLTPFNKGATTYAIVSINTIYVGKIDSQNNFVGNTFMRANAYLVRNNEIGRNPYQMVVAAFDEVLSGVVNVAIPHRVLSPYATTNPSQPVAALEVAGQFTNIVFGEGDKFTADAWVYTPNDQVTFNRTGTIEGAWYQVPGHADLYHIYASKFIDEDGKQGAFASADVLHHL